ncbi:nucleotidyltransferase family protein [Pseudomonas aeruginosa]|uniref:Nucleotidyltransferase family protein n=1 Tax=Stutzerimonas kunmingensis TaxID=1211807 RepID=A0A9X1N865_9GAMM|nr:MobA-like NTP transferase domain containing protein [Pseudomonas sp.]MBP2697833.1 NTP transferase domain-containing protein [Pseudomonas aeruginosa]MCD1610542.1 nucleotidyltransferase family protein [Stutzerimonas kunmingensis]QTB77658.1 nucleotidyltransferase family protein [Pseudomonas aeruginosa]QTB89799.1 nucleotidyltransferase family protein [Pseudomonas aeruginosa]
MDELEDVHYIALVLAADRHAGDAVARAAGVPCKALAPVGGIPMLRRVVNALQGSSHISHTMLIGPDRELLRLDPQIEQWLQADALAWQASASSPSASALNALERIPEQQPALITTADHALLSSVMVDHFLREATASEYDFVVGVARLDAVQARFPDTRRTPIRLRGGPYSGCNLFAVTTERGRRLADFWRRIEQERKHPRRVISGALGPVAVMRYLLGRLTLDEALARLSRRLDVKIGAVVMPFAEAAIDVDSPADLALVERIVAEVAGTAPIQA